MCQQPTFRFPPWLQQLLWGSSSLTSVSCSWFCFTTERHFKRDFNRQMQTGRKFFHRSLEGKFATGIFFSWQLLPLSLHTLVWYQMVLKKKVCFERASFKIAQKLSLLSHQKLATRKGTCHRSHRILATASFTSIFTDFNFSGKKPNKQPHTFLLLFYC